MNFLKMLGVAIVVILAFLIGAVTFRFLLSGTGRLPFAIQVLVAPAILIGIIYLYRKNKRNP